MLAAKSKLAFMAASLSAAPALSCPPISDGTAFCDRYPGITSMGKDSLADLAMHPTVKPVALVTDAIRDCSKRGGVVLDVLAGSGTTLIAARKCGRIARLIEFDPVYCDTIIRRYELLTGSRARLQSTGEMFEIVGLGRAD